MKQKELVAFDSKDFKRSVIINVPDETNSSKSIEKELSFFTPLGVGVTFKNEDLFLKDYLSSNENLSKSFQIKDRCPFYCSYHLKETLGLAKAIAFCDKLVSQVQDYIKLAHFSYVILSLAKVPTVLVGGEQCPTQELETQNFLRILSPMFSYITAWTFIKDRPPHKYRVHVDNFKSKITPAWYELISNADVAVYPRGDECNPFISFADILAFLTDVKLYHYGARKSYNEDFKILKDRRKLNPQNIKDVWKDYRFEINVRFLDQKILGMYKWSTHSEIKTLDYLARPVIFIMVDDVEKTKMQLATPSIETVEKDKSEVETKDLDTTKKSELKFRELVRKTSPFFYATQWAFKLNGSVQFFDKYIDTDKISSGDKIVYIGENSKKLAQTYADMFDVEVLPARELKNKI